LFPVRRCAVEGKHPVKPQGSSRPPADATDELAHRQAARYVWALLLARIYELLPLLCPRCGGAMRIIAFITEAAVIQAIPGHLGEPKQAPRLQPARGQPLWAMPDRGADATNPPAQPMPDHEFGKRVAWWSTRR